VKKQDGDDAAEKSKDARDPQKIGGEPKKVRVKKPGVTRTIESAELQKFLKLGWERV
jgi:hypothetical protein